MKYIVQAYCGGATNNTTGAFYTFHYFYTIQRLTTLCIDLTLNQKYALFLEIKPWNIGIIKLALKYSA